MSSKETALVALGVAAGWLATARIGATPVRADAVDGAGADRLVVAALGPGEGESVVVLDSTRKTFAVYHHDARRGKLRLAAVRRYGADLQLSEYNNDNPTVGEIERLTRPR